MHYRSIVVVIRGLPITTRSDQVIILSVDCSLSTGEAAGLRTLLCLLVFALLLYLLRSFYVTYVAEEAG